MIHGNLQEILKDRKKQYKELKKRIHREKELRVISQKLEVRKHLLVRVIVCMCLWGERRALVFRT